MRRGIDVSVYQGDINWLSIKNDGFDWAMIKCSQSTYEADKFSENINKAYANGLKCGVYHFLTAKTEAECDVEVDFLLSLLVRYRTLIKLYVCLDVESDKLPKDKSLLTRVVDKAYKRIEAEGYRCIVYTNLSWLRTRLDIGDKRLWLAWWRDPDKVPQQSDCPSGKLILWQWGCSYLPGIPTNNGQVDSNLMIVDEDEVPGISDCPNEWERKQAEKCIKSGLMSAKDGKFRPYDSVSRIELAIILNRLGGNT